MRLPTAWLRSHRGTESQRILQNSEGRATETRSHREPYGTPKKREETLFSVTLCLCGYAARQRRAPHSTAIDPANAATRIGSRSFSHVCSLKLALRLAKRP